MRSHVPTTRKRQILRILFVVAAVGLGIAFSLKPWQVYREQRHAADAALAEMKQAEKTRTDLMLTKDRYESPIGREELARSHGYRQANETPVDLQKSSQ